MRHVWVLGVAAIMVLLASRPVVPQAAPTLRNVAAIQINAVVQTASAAPMLVTRPAVTVAVHPGQTIATLAATYGSSAAAIRWANELGPQAVPSPGTTLLIPPAAGALVGVLPAETPTSFAARLHLDPAVVLDYNALVSNAPLAAGTYLQVPLNQAPRGSLVSGYFAVAARGTPMVPAQRVRSDTFPYGQCTYYVASRRIVTWAGNAVAWWWAAARIRPEGHVPVKGAIVVFGIGWTGHVAYVERVGTDGTFIISEMNYNADGGGWGRVDERTIRAADPSILGYIY